jgi:hypothetical protein
MTLEVECYAGWKADERPIRFQLHGHEYVIEAVLDQWCCPEHIFFKVRTHDGNVYVLRHDTALPDGPWALV